MRRADRSIRPMFRRGLAALAGRVQSTRNPDRPGSRGLYSRLREGCLRGRCKSMPRQGDREATARRQPRLWMLSPNGTTPEVDKAMQTEGFADFAHLRSAGRKETAQHPIPARLPDLELQTLGVTTQPLENPGQLRRDRGLSRIRLCLSDFRIKSLQQVQMVIHDRETTDGHGRNTRELLEPFLEPLFAVVDSFTQQDRTADLASRSGAGRGRINKFGSSHRQCKSPG
jgi:hypothetical protein